MKHLVITFFSLTLLLSSCGKQDPVPVAVTDITLDMTSVTLEVGSSITVTAFVSPFDAEDKSVTWESSDTTVVKVDEGMISALKPGNASVSATAVGGGKSAACSVTVTMKRPQVVDLGLSVKWASFNIGANCPEEAGDSFSWGELSPKKDSYWDRYNYCGGTYDSITKYCTMKAYGSVDNKTELDASDDAAVIYWGEGWRIPTNDEWQELEEECLKESVIVNGVPGLRLTSRTTGESIFLPVSVFSLESTGQSGYWSSSLCVGYPYMAWEMYLMYEIPYVRTSRGYTERYLPHYIRPVTD